MRGEGRKRFINTTPVFAGIRAAEGAGIIRALDWDGPTSRTTAIDPSGLDIVCAGIWRRTGPAAEECRTLKVCRLEVKAKLLKDVPTPSGSCTGGAWESRRFVVLTGGCVSYALRRLCRLAEQINKAAQYTENAVNINMIGPGQCVL